MPVFDNEMIWTPCNTHAECGTLKCIDKMCQ